MMVIPTTTTTTMIPRSVLPSTEPAQHGDGPGGEGPVPPRAHRLPARAARDADPGEGHPQPPRDLHPRRPPPGAPPPPLQAEHAGNACAGAGTAQEGLGGAGAGGPAERLQWGRLPLVLRPAGLPMEGVHGPPGRLLHAGRGLREAANPHGAGHAARRGAGRRPGPGHERVRRLPQQPGASPASPGGAAVPRALRVPPGAPRAHAEGVRSLRGRPWIRGSSLVRSGRVGAGEVLLSVHPASRVR